MFTRNVSLCKKITLACLLLILIYTFCCRSLLADFPSLFLHFYFLYSSTTGFKIVVVNLLANRAQINGSLTRMVLPNVLNAPMEDPPSAALVAVIPLVVVLPSPLPCQQVP